VLLLGKRLDFTLKFGRSPAFIRSANSFKSIPSPRRSSARAARWDAARGFRDRGRLRGARAIAEEARKQAPVAGSWLAEVRAAIAYRPAAWDGARSSENGRLHPVEALRPLQALLDAHPDSVFISDGGEIGQWAQACSPRRSASSTAWPVRSALRCRSRSRRASPCPTRRSSR